MSAYDNDPRVTNMGDGGYRLRKHLGEGVFGVITPGLFGGFEAGWADEENTATFDTADEAIRSLIGDPQ